MKLTKKVVTDNFVLSLSKEDKGFVTVINKLFHSNFNTTCSIDVYGDSDIWKKDIILITNDFLENTSEDCLLLQYGEYILLQRVDNQIYIDKLKLEAYPFSFISQKCQLEELGFLPFDL